MRVSAPTVSKGVTELHGAVGRPPASSRPLADHPGDRGGDANRAPRVGSEGNQRRPLPEADPRARRRSTGDSVRLGIPGVVRGVPVRVDAHAAERHLDRVRLAHRDRARCAQAGDEPGVPRPPLGKGSVGARVDGLAIEAVQVLHRHGNAGQGGNVTSVPEESVRLASGPKRAFGVEELVGAEPCIEAFVVRDGLLRDLHGGHGASAELRGETSESRGRVATSSGEAGVREGGVPDGGVRAHR